MEVSGVLTSQEPGERAPSTQLIGGWVGARRMSKRNYWHLLGVYSTKQNSVGSVVTRRTCSESNTIRCQQYKKQPRWVQILLLVFLRALFQRHTAWVKHHKKYYVQGTQWLFFLYTYTCSNMCQVCKVRVNKTVS